MIFVRYEPEAHPGCNSLGAVRVGFGLDAVGARVGMGECDMAFIKSKQPICLGRVNHHVHRAELKAFIKGFAGLSCDVRCLLHRLCHEIRLPGTAPSHQLILCHCRIFFGSLTSSWTSPRELIFPYPWPRFLTRKMRTGAIEIKVTKQTGTALIGQQHLTMRQNLIPPSTSGFLPHYDPHTYTLRSLSDSVGTTNTMNK